MADEHSPRCLFAFGDFRFDSRTGELSRAGDAVKLPPQPAKLLHLFLTSPGELITRDTIQKALWGVDTFVDFEYGIYKCVKQLRTALGDDANEPGFLQTVTRRGYRFIAEVRLDGMETESVGPEQAPFPGLSVFSGNDARHGESLLAGIGNADAPETREIPRKSVSEEGARRSPEDQEILSVFKNASGRDPATRVFRRLEAASLLPSPGNEGEQRERRIEIVPSGMRAVPWPLALASALVSASLAAFALWPTAPQPFE